ncbi:ervatamin-B [Amborella trichopoda]|nr:ervatamin-B [Amborella trichopoda]|eukprot:XP_006849385.2 ervatamin-B [Amborella trichopoda]
MGRGSVSSRAIYTCTPIPTILQRILTTINLSLSLIALVNMARLAISLSTVLFAAMFFVGHWLPLVAPRQLEEATMSVRFDQWMANHGVEYESIEEKEKRFNVFKENLRFIESVNAEKRSYKLSLNKFADLSLDEFRKQYMGLRGDVAPPKKAPVGPFMYANVSALALAPAPAPEYDTMDWREKGVVTPIKDQQDCGCCWAFSAVAAVESITKIKTGNSVSLSEQELVDCVTGGTSRGCQGGLMDEAFQFIINNGGLASEADYPYQAMDGACDAQKSSSKTSTITGYQNIPSGDEDSLLRAVANQPVSVGVDGSGFEFKHYSEGVFTGDCGTEMSHAVTAIGYGTTEDGTDYWLIKNSWGQTWGDKGYMKMQRGVNLCGIANMASYPVA